MFLGRATTTRALNTIASAYREAADSWRLTKDLKNARLAMINSELAQISRQTAPCRSLIDQLKSERDALFAELNSKEFDFTFNQDYRHGKAEAVQMLALKNMNNRQFNEALGAELTHLSCNYYGIFQDVLPIHWKRDFFESRSEDLMNLSVEFGSAQKAQAAFGNIISPGLTSSKPRIGLKLEQTDDERTKMFSFMLVDADVPLPKEKTCLPCPLWLAINVNVGNAESITDHGQEIISYTPPHPARGSGFHRFVWLAVEQKGTLREPDVKNKLIDAGWDAKKFLGSMDVVPRALTFHRAAWDQNVSMLFEEGRVRCPRRVLEANDQEVAEVQGENVAWKTEPVYGKPINQTWEMVNRGLYKYAFM